MRFHLVHQLVLLCLLGLVGAPYATAQTKARLVGTWDVLGVLDVLDEKVPGADESVTVTFTDDGRLLVTVYGTADNPLSGEKIKTSYRVEGDQVVSVDATGNERRLFFRVDGHELVLSPDFETEERTFLHRAKELAAQSAVDISSQ